MRYYIDLGVYDGDFLEKTISYFPPFDKYIGFEPIPEMCKEAREKFKDNSKIVINEIAVSDEDNDKAKFYINFSGKKGSANTEGNCIGPGSTLRADKTTGNIKDDKFIYVKVIDFAKYLKENFEEEDEIVLKINIEGAEYSLFKHLMASGAIRYISKIYCDWHYGKMKNKTSEEKRHWKVVEKLNKYGFDLKGDKSDYEIWEILK